MLETIYTDFTTKLLPKIAEGLVMTKDYFTDLFGRYVHFLIVRDIVVIGALLIICVISFFTYKYFSKKYDETKLSNKGLDRYDYDYKSDEGYMIGYVFSALVFIGCIAGSIAMSITLIKTIYVPEIVIYQQIKMFNQ